VTASRRARSAALTSMLIPSRIPRRWERPEAQGTFRQARSTRSQAPVASQHSEGVPRPDCR
jgi:hypothetical protein